MKAFYTALGFQTAAATLLILNFLMIYRHFFTRQRLAPSIHEDLRSREELLCDADLYVSRTKRRLWMFLATLTVWFVSGLWMADTQWATDLSKNASRSLGLMFVAGWYAICQVTSSLSRMDKGLGLGCHQCRLNMCGHLVRKALSEGRCPLCKTEMSKG